MAVGASSRSRFSPAWRSVLVPRVAGFFGAGALSLVAMLCLAAGVVAARHWGTPARARAMACVEARHRNATYRPARSVLCIALIAFATFVIVAVEAFKRDDARSAARSPLRWRWLSAALESLLPIVHDLNDPAGRDAMNLPAGGELERVTVRSIPRAPRRRHELPESVSAEESAHPRGDAGLHQRRAVRVSELAGRNARGARQPVAAAQSRVRGRRDTGDHRRKLDDLRAAHAAW